ncbi:collagen alpha-1(X) chain-like [Patiria miniata]|uniref:C1q domain-containing protein n=1 Tax=Patiria miniata TaxID=46514 RepID=A0A914AQI2_PATMI|nr:collagen alpha-1(X) chain-like [Patiria miniata]
MASQVMVRFVALFLSAFLLLWAVYRPCLAQPSDSETSAACPKGSCCSACFQGPAGPAGSAGIPGVPGNHGLHGSRGQKGEPGSDLPGPKGDMGDHGQKGEQGEPGVQGLVGQPGKLGPAGPSGEKGENGGKGQPGLGLPGPKGDMGDRGLKGELGDATYLTPPIVAFSAFLNTHFTGNHGDVIIFDRVKTNIGGAYDPETGVFTCNLAGVYFFSVSILGRPSAGPRPNLRLVMNDEDILYVLDGHPGFYHQSTNSVVLVMASGDTVRLFNRSGSGTSITGYKDSCFSGYLIQAM